MGFFLTSLKVNILPSYFSTEGLSVGQRNHMKSKLQVNEMIHVLKTPHFCKVSSQGVETKIQIPPNGKKLIQLFISLGKILNSYIARTLKNLISSTFSAEFLTLMVSAAFQLRIWKNNKTHDISSNPEEYMFHTLFTY